MAGKITDFSYKVISLPLFISIVCIAPCYPVYADEPLGRQNYLSIGVGWEQLSYKEKVPELSLSSSNTEVTNLILYVDGVKTLNNYFLGFSGIVPITYGDSQEDWERLGQFEQSNSLSYRQTRINVFGGYVLHHLFNPYIGTNWSYSRQKRSDFQLANTQSIDITVKEEVTSLSLLVGVRGKVPIITNWSFSYFIEYLLPYYSKIENDSLDGWEASDNDGYAYSLSGQLEYLINEGTSITAQVIGGRQSWDGSEWEIVGDSRVKWPENETEFIGGYVNFKKYF